MIDFSAAFQAGTRIRAQDAARADVVHRPLGIAPKAATPDKSDPVQDFGNFQVYQVLRLTGLSDRDARAAARAADIDMQNAGGSAASAPTASPVAGATSTAGGIQISSQSLSIEVSQVNINVNSGTITQSGTATKLEWSHTLSRIVEVSTQVDPLVLDLTGEGLSFSGSKNGRLYDINGDGKLRMTSWIEGDNAAFLALDRNGNGSIDNGGELFGDQHGAQDGFAELSKFDDNADGTIDDKDAVFHMLLLVAPDGKTRGLAEAGITQLHISGVIARDTAYDGARETAQSAFTRSDGSQGSIHDVWLDVQA
jgi:hypothetical protein